MSFHDVRLPDDVERGASGGPEFSTTITELASGFEQRNADWAKARLSFDIGYGIQDKAGFQEVIKFFYARRGRLFGFRFKDWSDYEATGEQIGTGDGVITEFQLQKTYSDMGGSYIRFINKPVTGTVVLYVDDVVVDEADYTVDYSTGVVTFDAPVINTGAVTADFEFDVPVRFDVDKADLELTWSNAGSVPNIPVVELRQEQVELNA